MRTLVTGGAGFIGSAIVPELRKEGFEIYVLDNLSFGNRNFIDIPDELFFLADIRDKKKVEGLIDHIKPEAIIHLAAIHFIPYCNMHPYEAADINIRGTLNLLEASKKYKNLKCFFFASTAAVYALSDLAMKEDDDLLPMDIYGLSKMTGESLCRKFWLETGTDTVVCRFFNAFGPNETNAHLFPEIERQLKEGCKTIKLGNLTPKRDYIHTYDMAFAIKKLLQLEEIGFEIFNLGRGIEYSVVEIVDAFSRQLDKKINIEVDPSKVRKVEREHLLADISKIKKRTGWEPIWNIDEGIANLVQNWNDRKK